MIPNVFQYLWFNQAKSVKSNWAGYKLQIKICIFKNALPDCSVCLQHLPCQLTVFILFSTDPWSRLDLRTAKYNDVQEDSKLDLGKGKEKHVLTYCKAVNEDRMHTNLQSTILI